MEIMEIMMIMMIMIKKLSKENSDLKNKLNISSETLQKIKESMDLLEKNLKNDKDKKYISADELIKTLNARAEH